MFGPAATVAGGDVARSVSRWLGGWTVPCSDFA